MRENILGGALMALLVGLFASRGEKKAADFKRETEKEVKFRRPKR